MNGGVSWHRKSRCYENTSGNERDYNQEDLAISVNILYRVVLYRTVRTRLSRDPLVHEDGRALALMKCLIQTCYVSLIVMALWILNVLRQRSDVVDLSTIKGIYQPRLCLYEINTSQWHCI